MLKVLVMVSGGGTNLQAIIDSVENGTVTNTKIVGVISNNQNAYALKRADKHGIAAECVSLKNFEIGLRSMRNYWSVSILTSRI